MSNKRTDNTRLDARLGDLSPNKTLATVRERQQQNNDPKAKK